MAVYDTLEASQNWYAHVEDAMGDPGFLSGSRMLVSVLQENNVLVVHVGDYVTTGSQRRMRIGTWLCRQLGSDRKEFDWFCKNQSTKRIAAEWLSGKQCERRRPVFLPSTLRWRGGSTGACPTLNRRECCQCPKIAVQNKETLTPPWSAALF